MKILVITIIGSLCILAFSCTLKPQPSCGFNRTYGQRITWGNNLPISVYIDPSVSPEYVQSISRAVYTWNSAGNKQLFTFVLVPRADVTVQQPETWKNNNNIEADTFVAWQGSTIYQSTVSINNLNFHYFEGPIFYDSPEVSMDSVMLHEFGHVLGLLHQSGTVMDPVLLPDTYRMVLGDHELNALKCGYGDFK